MLLQLPLLHSPLLLLLLPLLFLLLLLTILILLLLLLLSLLLVHLSDRIELKINVILVVYVKAPPTPFYVKASNAALSTNTRSNVHWIMATYDWDDSGLLGVKGSLKDNSTMVVLYVMAAWWIGRMLPTGCAVGALKTGDDFVW